MLPTKSPWGNTSVRGGALLSFETGILVSLLIDITPYLAENRPSSFPFEEEVPRRASETGLFFVPSLMLLFIVGDSSPRLS